MLNTINISEKFKNIKLGKKEICIILIGFLLIFIIFISEYNNDSVKIESDINNTEYNYCNEMEEKIKKFIMKIDGAGKTEVIITLDETSEYIYATDNKNVQKNNNNNDDLSVENDYVIIENNNNDEGLLIKTIEPKIRGVAITCEGGDIPEVQENIMSAIKAVLDIRSSNISITKLSSEDAYEE